MGYFHRRKHTEFFDFIAEVVVFLSLPHKLTIQNGIHLSLTLDKVDKQADLGLLVHTGNICLIFLLIANTPFAKLETRFS